MPEDRGGLRYRIEVQDKFTRTSQSFRTEMKKNRAEFARFRQSMSKSRGDASKFAREVAAMNKSLAAFGAARDKMAARDSAAARDAAEVKKLRAQYERVTAIMAKQRRLLAQTRAEQRGVTNEVKRTERAVRGTNTQRSRAVRQQRAVTAETQRTATAANRVAFTFRRLFGILAAFQAARMGVRGFVDLIKSSIDFNKQIEDSRISIAALIVATGEVKDEQGKVVKGAKAFAAAQQEAARQSALLRQDALKTTATYGELLKAFQAGVGPGLEAGLNLDQIREVTIRVSQAAGALGLAQNQLIEEIRSLLRGTIQARTTIVASVLGITNADVRRAKEAGNLFDFLSARLEGFKLAAAETQNTVSGLTARLRDAIAFAAGVAGVDFFASLKASLRDIFSTLVSIKKDAKGVIQEITPRPETVKVLRGLFDGLGKLMDATREGLKGLDVKPLAEGFADIASLITGADMKTAFEAMVALAEVVGTAIFAALESLRDVARLVAPLIGLVDVFSPLIAIIVRFRVILWSVNLISLSIVRTLSSLPAILMAGKAAADMQAAALTRMKAIVPTIAIGLGLAALAAQPLVQTFLGINASMSDSILLLGKGFADALDDAVAKTKILAIRVKDALSAGGKPGEDFLVDTAPRAAKRYAKAFDSALNVNLRNVAALFGSGNAVEKYFDRQAKASYKSLTDEMSKDYMGPGLTDSEQKILDIQEKRKKAHLDLGRLVQEVAERSKAAGADQEASTARLLALQKELNKFFVKGVNRKEAMNEQDRMALFLSHQKAYEVRLELEAKRDLLVAEREGLRGNQLALKKNQAERANLRERLLVERAIYTLKIQQQQKALETAAGTATEADERQKLKLLLYEEKNALGGIILDMDTLQLQAEKLRQTMYGSITEGMAEGLKDFAEQFGSAFQAGVNIAQSLTSELASFISTSIVDAFDPTKEFDIVERFAQLMQQIAQVILQQLIQLAIAKAIIKAGLGSAGSFAEGGVIGLASGGEIPNRPAAPAIRPAGLHPTDKVPIWAAHGEFMQRAAAVKKYGVDVMEKINSGLVDPTALKALAGVKSLGRVRHSSAGRRGYATGGEIVRDAETAVAQAPASPTAAGGPVPAFLIMDGQATDKMLNSNSASYMRWFRQNSKQLKGILGVSKQ